MSPASTTISAPVGYSIAHPPQFPTIVDFELRSGYCGSTVVTPYIGESLTDAVARVLKSEGYAPGTHFRITAIS